VEGETRRQQRRNIISPAATIADKSAAAVLPVADCEECGWRELHSLDMGIAGGLPTPQPVFEIYENLYPICLINQWLIDSVLFRFFLLFQS